MRALRLIAGECRFLLRYGIAFLYVIFLVVYLCLLGALPASARGAAAELLTFTDPAAMGLFFMGAVILLEKSQRTGSSIAVSPVRIWEYMCAKLAPLMLLGLAVGGILCAAGGCGSLGSALIGIALSSVLFSLCGLFTAVNTETLNGFLVATIPFELVICLPAVLYLFDVISSPLWLLHPGSAAIRLIMGVGGAGDLLSLLCWTALMWVLCRRSVGRYFAQMGGGRL